jgi:multidrug transporter EmrE-like cation transporter
VIALISIYLVIFITLVAALIASFAQVLFKKTLGRQSMSIRGIVRAMFTSRNIVIGLAAYMGSLALYLFALDNAPLSVVYPLFASTFIFIAVFSKLLLKETFSIARIAGTALVFVGIVVIAFTI